MKAGMKRWICLVLSVCVMLSAMYFPALAEGNGDDGTLAPGVTSETSTFAPVETSTPAPAETATPAPVETATPAPTETPEVPGEEQTPVSTATATEEPATDDAELPSQQPEATPGAPEQEDGPTETPEPSSTPEVTPAQTAEASASPSVLPDAVLLSEETTIVSFDVPTVQIPYGTDLNDMLLMLPDTLMGELANGEKVEIPVLTWQNMTYSQVDEDPDNAEFYCHAIELELGQYTYEGDFPICSITYDMSAYGEKVEVYWLASIDGYTCYKEPDQSLYHLWGDDMAFVNGVTPPSGTLIQLEYGAELAVNTDWNMGNSAFVSSSGLGSGTLVLSNVSVSTNKDNALAGLKLIELSGSTLNLNGTKQKIFGEIKIYAASKLIGNGVRLEGLKTDQPLELYFSNATLEGDITFGEYTRPDCYMLDQSGTLTLDDASYLYFTDAAKFERVVVNKVGRIHTADKIGFDEVCDELVLSGEFVEQYLTNLLEVLGHTILYVYYHEEPIGNNIKGTTIPASDDYDTDLMLTISEVSYIGEKEFTELQAGEQALMRLKCTSENSKITWADGDETVSDFSVTILSLPVLLKDGVIEKTYDGTNAVKNDRLLQPQFTSYFDTDSPLLLHPEDYSFTISGTMRNLFGSDLNVAWKNGQPAQRTLTVDPGTADSLHVTIDGQDAGSYGPNVGAGITLQYLILPATVTVSGVVRHDATVIEGAADAMKNNGLTYTGFCDSDSFETESSSFTTLQLLDANGKNLLDKTEPGIYEVKTMKSVGGNYCFEPVGLTVEVYRDGEGTVSIQGWSAGQTPNAPQASSTTHSGEASFTYATPGTDIRNDSLWSTAAPQTPGTYVVRALWPAQNGMGRLICTQEFEVTINTVDWSKVYWNYVAPNYTVSTVTLQNLPQWLQDDVQYTGNVAELGSRYYTATVSFPSYPEVEATMPEELKTLEWALLPGGGPSFNVYYQGINCELTVRARAEDGEFHSGDPAACYQQLYFYVDLPEGYKMNVVASTNSSYSQLSRNVYRIYAEGTDEEPVYRVEMNSSGEGNVYLLFAAIKEDQPSIKEQTVNLNYYAASPDGFKTAYGDTYDLRQAFNFSDNVPYAISSVWSSSTGYRIQDTMLYVTGRNTGSELQLQLSQGIDGTIYYYNLIAKIVIRSVTVKINVVQQENFIGTITLPDEVAAPGTVLQPSLVNVTDEEAGRLVWKWQRQGADGVWTDIPGETAIAYTATPEDVGCKLRLTYSFGNGYRETNAVDCVQNEWNGSLHLTLSRDAFHVGENVTATMQVLDAQGRPAAGKVQFYLDGAIFGGAQTLNNQGEASCTLQADGMTNGVHSVFAVLIPTEGKTFSSGFVYLQRNKVDISDLFVINYPDGTDVCYAGTALGGGNLVSITKGEGWPEGYQFTDTSRFTVRYMDSNGDISADLQKIYETRTDDQIAFDILEVGENFTIQVILDDEDYTGSVLSNVHMVDRPITIKAQNLAVPQGETPALAYQVLENGQSMGLGDGDWLESVTYVVRDSNGDDVTSQLDSLPAGRYTYGIQNLDICGAIQDAKQSVAEWYSVTKVDGLLFVGDIDYTVTIPSTLQLDETGAGAIDFALDSGAEDFVQVQVVMHSENGFALKDGQLEIPYQVTDGQGQAIAQDGIAAELRQDGEEATVYVQAEKPKANGHYTDRLTFSITQTNP